MKTKRGRPADPVLKTLAELAPADWLPLLGRRRRRVTCEDSDIGTVFSGATDKLFRVHDKPDYLLHLDFESGHFHSRLPFALFSSEPIPHQVRCLPQRLLGKGAGNNQLLYRLASPWSN